MPQNKAGLLCGTKWAFVIWSLQSTRIGIDRVFGVVASGLCGEPNVKRNFASYMSLSFLSFS